MKYMHYTAKASKRSCFTMEIPKFSFRFPSFGVNDGLLSAKSYSVREPDTGPHLSSNLNVKKSKGSQKIIDSYISAFQNRAKDIEQDLLQAEVLLDLLEKVDRNIKIIEKVEEINDMQKYMQRTFTLLGSQVTQITGKIKGLKIENESSKMLPGCGEESNAYQMRMEITGGLKEIFLKLLNRLLGFQQEMEAKYKISMDKSSNTAPRMKQDSNESDNVTETGESEEIKCLVYHQKAIQELMDSMVELHDVFLNMPTTAMKKVTNEGESTQNISTGGQAPGKEFTSEGEQNFFNEKEHESRFEILWRKRRDYSRVCLPFCCWM